ncbi:MAG: hypothetical protein WA974_17650 [Thermodesulfobacteriota bacterium]
MGKKGEDALRQFTQRTGVPVYAIAPISEVVEYLFEGQIPVQIEGSRQPISADLKRIFDDYLKEYGTGD